MGLGLECTLTLLSRARVIHYTNLIQDKHAEINQGLEDPPFSLAAESVFIKDKPQIFAVDFIGVQATKMNRKLRASQGPKNGQTI